MNNLLERFLIYSLQHRRAIKVMLMLEGQHATQAIAEDEGLGPTPFTAPLA